MIKEVPVLPFHIFYILPFDNVKWQAIKAVPIYYMKRIKYKMFH